MIWLASSYCLRSGDDHAGGYAVGEELASVGGGEVGLGGRLAAAAGEDVGLPWTTPIGLVTVRESTCATGECRTERG
jgi:hypothetical protein